MAAGTSTSASVRGTVVRLGEDQARTGRLPCVETEAGVGAPATDMVENGRPRPIPAPRDGVLWWSIYGGEGTEASASFELNSEVGDLGDV